MTSFDFEKFKSFLKSVDDIPTPQCGEQFDIPVENEVEVERCGNVSDDESTKMYSGLIRKWRRDAYAVCDRLDGCNEPELVGWDPSGEDSSCGSNRWKISVIIKTKCIK